MLTLDGAPAQLLSALAAVREAEALRHEADGRRRDHARVLTGLFVVSCLGPILAWGSGHSRSFGVLFLVLGGLTLVAWQRVAWLRPITVLRRLDLVLSALDLLGERLRVELRFDATEAAQPHKRVGGDGEVGVWEDRWLELCATRDDGVQLTLGAEETHRRYRVQGRPATPHGKGTASSLAERSSTVFTVRAKGLARPVRPTLPEVVQLERWTESASACEIQVRVPEHVELDAAAVEDLARDRQTAIERVSGCALFTALLRPALKA